MKKLLALFILFLCSCSLSPRVFRVEKDLHENSAFEYCGAQQFGFVKKIGQENPSYFAVYYEYSQVNGSDVLLFTFSIQTKKEATVVFSKKDIKIKENGSIVYNKPLDLWIVYGIKSVYDKFSSSQNFVVRSVSEKNGLYTIYKKKYGGFFGDIFLEKVSDYQTPTIPNTQAAGNQIYLSFNPEINDEIYLTNKFVLPSKTKIISSGKFEILTPEFKVNEVIVKEDKFIINFDRDLMLEKAKTSYRCASMSEIFWHNRERILWK